ncbi:hypothetical protein LH128_25483 [Sphingomonas sp. LH128]|uniref:hypothetical protein n=1 Tax=Sphingomonas sp. LH128 TaxID=473781 RepID=UPI00027C9CB5|nr:hypothetical protein LH128_25483 [Sphingomonas sp. LH128]
MALLTRLSMVDILALAISHGLLLLAAWRLLWRPDLDSEGGDSKARPRRKPGTPMRVNRAAGEEDAHGDA